MAVKAQVFERKKRLLLTGCNGFVGRNFITRSTQLNAFNLRLATRKGTTLPIVGQNAEFADGDLLDANVARRLCEKVDVVVNLAGVMMTSTGRRNGELASARDNVTLHLNLAEAARDAGVEKYIWFSSTTGYPILTEAASEKSFQCGDVPIRYFTVGATYRFLEKIITHCFKEEKTILVTLRPTGIYGEGDNFDPKTAHVLPAFISRCIAGDIPKSVFADKNERRDWIYVGDVVNAIDAVLTKVTSPRTLNIGSGQSTSMHDLYLLMRRLMGVERNCRIILDEFDPESAIDRSIDCSLSRAILGDYSLVGLEQGLTRTIEWYRSRKIGNRE